VRAFAGTVTHHVLRERLSNLAGGVALLRALKALDGLTLDDDGPAPSHEGAGRPPFVHQSALPRREMAVYRLTRRGRSGCPGSRRTVWGR
jgi:hypothetical protein